MSEEKTGADKKPMPTWVKLLLASGAGAATATGGQKLATDSPVHFAVVGEAPMQHDGWSCAPEGGIVGAPMVCRPVAVSEEGTSTEVSTVDIVVPQ